MKEIFTINSGFSGNFSSAYFWQIQDMYEKLPSFYENFFVQSLEGYFPRMLGIDYKESLSFPVCSQVEEKILWAGKIQKIDQEPGSEQKWTDLLAGMVSRRNLLPVYRDESPSEQIEEKIRWFSERSDKLQGTHILQDCNFYESTQTSLEILSDSYPKLPVLLFSMNFSFSTQEEIMLLNFSEFSNILYIPCTESNSKIWYSRLGAALDCISYSYRDCVEMSSVLQEFFTRPRGNTAGLVLNHHQFLLPAPVYTQKEFVRGADSIEQIPVPLEFPDAIPDPTRAFLYEGEALRDFYKSFNAVPDHNTNPEDLNEARNYLKTLEEYYTDSI
jgi:hypothetical protein